MRASQLGILEKQDRQAHLVTAALSSTARAHLSTLTMMGCQPEENEACSAYCLIFGVP